MRHISFMLLILGLLVVGCDSNDSDESSDHDVFVGTWTMVGISDGNGDRSGTFQEGYDSVQITFSDDHDIQLIADAKIDLGDATYSGTYDEVESSNTLTANVSTGGTTVPLTFTYDIESDNRMSVTTTGNTSSLLASLFQTTFAPEVKITLIKGS